MVRLDSRSVFLATVLLTLASPVLTLAIVSTSVLGQIALLALTFAASATSSSRPAAPDDNEESGTLRFSVHIAAHEEPPALVSRTLRAFARQDGVTDFEVIVLDNNTSDPATWKPVELLCRELGPRFRFFHKEGVEGAKAGALNIALQYTHPDTTHIVIVDADYEVTPDFLSVVENEIRLRDDDFIQFPQAYRNTEGQAAGLSLELANYFMRHARLADGADAMLLTGTLSVIRRSALLASGGWSGRTITEDAELGLRLRRRGYRGRFVDKIVGRGVMPLDVGSLGLQRYRWAAGNMSTILTGFSGLRPRAALHVVSQLTAWANFGLPLAAGLIGGGLAMALRIESGALGPMTSLAGMGLAIVYLSSVLPLIFAAASRSGSDLRTTLSALAARIMLIVPSAAGTMDALLGLRGSFRRTPKDAEAASDSLDPILPGLALGGLVLLATPALPPFALLGAILLILPYPFARATKASLSAYRTSLQTS
ncbi:MAG: glycosyltransferase [Nitratireductor sp.]|nr:glycosyltransferase [Nitratireductor sp.]